MPLHTQDAALDETQSSPLRPVDVERYEVANDAQLGEGGLGTVLRARDKRLNRWVAIKLLRRLSAEHEQRFFYEAELTAGLEHPAIVPVHDVGRWHSGEPFYAMKLVEGQSLRELAASCTTLASRLPLLVNVLTVCDALGFAHARGVIHRDLKPSNVMVGQFGETMVIDWGLARHVGAADAAAISGTPHYMSPEQASGQTVDARSDVYALGAMLYEVLSGRAPYEGTPSNEVLALVTKQAPEPLLTVEPDAPHELAAIVGKAMHREPSQRYPDARGVAAELRRYFDGHLVGAYDYSPWQRVRRSVAQNKPTAAAIVVGLVALVSLGSVSLSRIVTERDLARDARARAEQERTTAEARRDALLFSQAQLWLEKDPTTAFAWVRSFANTSSARPESVSRIAADAVARGVASQLVRGRKRVVLSPDGQTLAGVEDDHLVLWSLTDAHARVLGKARGQVSVLRFAPDGLSLLAAEGTTLRRWPLTGGEPVTLFTDAKPVTAVAVSGASIAVGGDEGGVWSSTGGAFEARPSLGARINWLEASSAHGRLVANDVDGKFEILPLENAGPALLMGQSEGGARMSADGTRVGWSSAGGALYAFDLARGVRSALPTPHLGGELPAVALSADGRWLASFGQDKVVVLDNLVTHERRLLKGHEGWVLNGAFSPDGRQLVTVSTDRSARLWDLATEDVQVLRGHNSAFRTFTFTPDSRHLITADAEGEVRVWSALAPTEQIFRGHQSDFIEARFLPDGRLASAGEDGQLNLWTPATGQRVALTEAGSGGSLNVTATGLVNGGGGGVWFRALTDPKLTPHTLQTNEAHRVVVSDDGTMAATASTDHVVRLFTLPAGTERQLGVHTAAVWNLVFSPDGRFVASSGDDFPVRVWPVHEGAPLTLEGPQAVIFDLHFSPDGRWLAAGGIDATVHLWDTRTWAYRALRGHVGAVRQLAFSADSSKLASASDDHTVRVWSMGSQSSPQVLPHVRIVYVVLFSRDGKQVVSGADDGALRSWDLATGTLLAVHAGHASSVSMLQLSPDGQAVVSTSDDHTVRLWPDFFHPAPALDSEAALGHLSSVTLQDDRAGSPTEAL